MATQIKPKQIFDVLDVAWAVRQAGGNFVPCFAGDSGIGKSETQQTWAKKKGIEFIDVRLAYLEGPDLIGLPNIVEVTIDGKVHKTTVYALPEFLPKSGQALIVFEEPNRAHESTMNAVMQVFTDRKIGSYKLPDGVILSMAINPEGQYNVNSLDPALKNRVAMYDVKYDHLAFVEFMKEQEFHPVLLGFIAESGHWNYSTVEEIQKSTDGVYISPRTISHVNNILKAVENSHPAFFESIAGYFGTSVAADYIKFANELRPVMFEDLLKDKKGSLKKLKEMTESPNYSGDMLSVTVQSIVNAFESGKCPLDLVFEVVNVIEKDQAVELICAISDKMNTADVEKMFKDFEKEFEKLNNRVRNKVEKVKKQANQRQKSKTA